MALLHLKNKLSAGLLLLCLLIYLHPYSGIRHDSILYLGQALLWRDPVNFRNDLFFAFGGQSSFTIFPALVAGLLEYFSASTTFLVMTQLSLIFFLFASFFAVRSIFSGRLYFYGVLALLILPSGYGAGFIFSYAESFFTGRSLAEPLVLLAFGFYWRSCFKVAGLLWLLAALIHPLQAIPLLIVVWCDLVLQRRQWLNVLWLPLLAMVMGWAGFPIFDRIVMPFDTEWFSWIRDPNQNVFLWGWHFPDWTFLLTDVFLLALLYVRLPQDAARLAGATLLAIVIGFAGVWVFADQLQISLLTGVQLWRVQWLGHWFAIAGLPYLLQYEFQAKGFRGVRLWLLIDIIILGAPALQTASSCGVVWGLIPLFFLWPSIENKIQPIWRKAFFLTLPAVLALLLVKYGIYAYGRYVEAAGDRAALRPEVLLFSHPVVVTLLIGCGVFFYQKFPRAKSFVLGILLVWSIVAFQQWDRRNLWTNYVESAESAENRFGVLIEPGAQIYWMDELLAPWLILHRASYFSGDQTAGLLFSRATAEEATRRRKMMGRLDLQANVCRMMNKLNKTNDACTVDVEVLTRVCQDSAGQLDYLVLTNPVARPFVGSWSIEAVLKDGKDVTYYMYACRDLL